MASSSDASTGFDNQQSQVRNVATYSGNFQSHGQTWMGNTLNAAGDVHIHHDVRTEAPQQAQQERAQMSSNVYISGQARVHLGDNYAANRHLFETGTEEEKRAGESCLLHAGCMLAYSQG